MNIPFTPEAIVLANGRFPSSPALLSLLSTHLPIICCDGASAHLYQLGIKPHIIIGDLDSITSAVSSAWHDIIVHDPDQSTNDLTKSINHCKLHGWKKIVVLGATGQREDHTLANISLLHEYLSLQMMVVIVSDYGMIIPIAHTTKFTSFARQQVSIISLTPECHLSTDGLKYPIDNKNLSSLWNGSLNEALTDSFTITLHQPGKILVYQTHDAK